MSYLVAFAPARHLLTRGHRPRHARRAPLVRRLRALAPMLAVSLFATVLNPAPAHAACLTPACVESEAYQLATLAGNTVVGAVNQPTVDALVTDTIRLVGPCMTDPSNTCQQLQSIVLTLVTSGVTTLENFATTCANGTNQTCNDAEQLGKQLINLAIVTAEECANGDDQTCAQAEALARSLVQDVETFVTTCVAGTNGTCTLVEQTAMQVVADALALVNTCVARTNGTCNTVFALEQQVVALATGAVQNPPSLQQVSDAINTVVGTVYGIAGIVAGGAGPVVSLILAEANSVETAAGATDIERQGADAFAIDLDLTDGVSAASTLGSAEELTSAGSLVQTVASTSDLNNTGITQGPDTTFGSSGGTPPPCYYSQSGPNFKAYKPFYAHHMNDQVYVQYEYAPFVQLNARFVTGEGETNQVELCQMGGGKSRNGNRLNTIGTAMAVMDNTTDVIGWTTINASTVNPQAATLNFELDASKYAKIDGSISVTPVKKETGGQGNTNDALGLSAYPQNEVYQAWKGLDSPRTNVQGSDDYEGNISHGLWEFPQGYNLNKVQIEVVTYYGTNCPWYRDCG